MRETKIARDKTNRAILSVDNLELEEYKKTRKILRNRTKEIQDLNERLSRLEKIIFTSDYK